MLASPLPVHIPDGFLSPLVSAVGWIAAIALLALGLRQTRRHLGERMVPLMGVLAAFIFAAQAVNFPVAAGTSGHLIGGALAAIVLGPWAGFLVMTVVVGVQALLFQDGGLVVMGWNIVNMAGLTAFSGYAVYRLVSRVTGEHRVGVLAAAFAGAWVSVEVGAVATALELAASGTAPADLALPAMASVHALIGIGEGALTAGSLGLLLAARPGIVQEAGRAPGRNQALVAFVGLAVALLLALVSPFSSPSPDGLVSVAEAQGFADQASAAWTGLAPGYLAPGVNEPALATIVAVAAGSLTVSVVAVIVGRLGRRGAPSGG